MGDSFDFLAFGWESSSMRRPREVPESWFILEGDDFDEDDGRSCFF